MRHLKKSRIQNTVVYRGKGNKGRGMKWDRDRIEERVRGGKNTNKVLLKKSMETYYLRILLNLYIYI